VGTSKKILFSYLDCIELYTPFEGTLTPAKKKKTLTDLKKSVAGKATNFKKSHKAYDF